MCWKGFLLEVGNAVKKLKQKSRRLCNCIVLLIRSYFYVIFFPQKLLALLLLHLLLIHLGLPRSEHNAALSLSVSGVCFVQFSFKLVAQSHCVSALFTRLSCQAVCLFARSSGWWKLALGLVHFWLIFFYGFCFSVQFYLCIFTLHLVIPLLV